MEIEQEQPEIIKLDYSEHIKSYEDYIKSKIIITGQDEKVEQLLKFIHQKCGHCPICDEYSEE